MTSCLNTRDNICAYIDQELNEEEKLCFEEHISNCSGCRRDLEEMTRIVGLCTRLPQQELPADFTAELHEKLLAVADRQVRDSRNIWKKKGFLFTRTVASIAAGVLLIFLAGNFVKYGLNSSKTADSAAPQSADMAMAAEAPSAAKLDIESGSNGVARAELEADGAAIADDAVTHFSMSVDESKSVEVDRSATIEEREASMYTGGMAAGETVYYRMSTVTITADEPEEMAQTVKVLAAGNGGEEAAATMLKIQDANAESIEVRFNEAIAGVQTPLRFVFQQNSYDRFITVLNDALGAANVQMGAFVTEDVTDTINSMIKESEAADERLQELQKKNKSEDSEEINRLKTQKETIEAKIEKMRLDSDIVTVTIYINKK